eukprot:10232488-Alexandrium_andersonii.AAC.1
MPSTRRARISSWPPSHNSHPPVSRGGCQGCAQGGNTSGGPQAKVTPGLQHFSALFQGGHSRSPRVDEGHPMAVRKAR